MVTAKDFKIPYTWQERHVVIENRIWFVPVRPVKTGFVFTDWHTSGLFSSAQPVAIEYCSGNGSWILEKAKEMPHINWLAVEKRFDRARKIWVKATNAGLSNLAVALAEGLDLTSQFIPDNSVSQVFVNFPDPWPKRRHEKHRIICPEFVCELTRVIQHEGKITLVTDDDDYSAIMIEEMQKSPHCTSDIGPPYFCQAPDSYGTSFFDTLFRDLKRTIRMHLFSVHKP